MPCVLFPIRSVLWRGSAPQHRKESATPMPRICDRAGWRKLRVVSAVADYPGSGTSRDQNLATCWRAGSAAPTLAEIVGLGSDGVTKATYPGAAPMIHVLAIITAKPGMRDAILKEFRANMPAVHAENGCIEYGPAIDAEGWVVSTKFGDDTFVVIEKWESPEALKAHAAAPHMAAYGGKDARHDRKPRHPRAVAWVIAGLAFPTWARRVAAANRRPPSFPQHLMKYPQIFLLEIVICGSSGLTARAVMGTPDTCPQPIRVRSSSTWPLVHGACARAGAAG